MKLNKTEVIKFRVSEVDKVYYENYARDMEYSTLSSFIKDAMADKIVKYQMEIRQEKSEG
jgi:hypothetical protein